MQETGIAGQLFAAWRGFRLGFGLPTQHCHLCRARAGSGLLCGPCAADLPPLPAEHCPLCALPVPGGEICGRCLAEPPAFDRTQALWSYDFPVDTLIQALKYGHQLALSRFLGEALAQLAPAGSDPHAIDLILPVPLSAGHLRQRGFNQAVEIARPLARQLGLSPAIDVCSRVRETAAQTSLPWKARQKNLRNAFECHRDLSGLHVLVVDDVMTTGATLNELARTLKKHGAATVSNRVCARALKH